MEQLRQQKKFVVLKFVRVILHVHQSTIHVRAPRVDPNFWPTWFKPRARLQTFRVQNHSAKRKFGCFGWKVT